ncbi:MAG: hypothetical protein AAF354_12200, partial [Pseudomonadota bacterium]
QRRRALPSANVRGRWYRLVDAGTLKRTFGNMLILPLEDRFPRADLDQPPAPAGVIILGGAENRLIGGARKAPTLNEAGERLLEGAILAKRFPNMKVAFSGGDAGIL